MFVDSLNDAESLSFIRECAELFGNLVLLQKVDYALNQIKPSKCSQKLELVSFFLLAKFG